MAFRIGQRVVCVDVGPGYDGSGKSVPFTLNAIYIVDGLVAIPVPSLIIAGYPSWHSTKSWNQLRFRPVAEKKTDISTLTALLNPLNHKHLEGV